MFNVVNVPEVMVSSLAGPQRCGMKRCEVGAVVNKCFNRAQHCELERQICYAWHNAQCCCCPVENKIKFRLYSAQPSATGLTLSLGLTCCKDYIGTNCKARHVSRCWEALGSVDCGDRGAFFANPLSCGVIVHTYDDKYVYVRRKQDCCEKAWFVDRVLGYPDPLVMDIDPELNDLPFVDRICSANSPALVNEIWDTATRAVVDEIGIKRKWLTEPVLMGITYNRARAWRPCLEFYMTTGLDSNKVFFDYVKRFHGKSNQTSDIIFAKWCELFNTDSSMYRSFDAAARGSVWLYTMMAPCM